MTNKILEEKINPKQVTKNIGKSVTTRCLYCGKALQISKNHSLERNREYTGFYVSPEGNLYCDKIHFTLFTED